MTKYEAVAQAIKNDIENGLYKEGQPIPTEELLTAQYDVSRQTIRKALSLLVEDNLILKRQGSGSVVRPKRLNPREDSCGCNIHQRLYFPESAAGSE